MPRSSRACQLQPERRFLGNANVVDARFAIFADPNAAAFVKHQANLFENFWVFLDKITSAQRSPGFFVSRAKKNHVALERDVLALERQQRD